MIRPTKRALEGRDFAKILSFGGSLGKGHLSTTQGQIKSFEELLATLANLSPVFFQGQTTYQSIHGSLACFGVRGVRLEVKPQGHSGDVTSGRTGNEAPLTQLPPRDKTIKGDHRLGCHDQTTGSQTGKTQTSCRFDSLWATQLLFT